MLVSCGTVGAGVGDTGGLILGEFTTLTILLVKGIIAHGKDIHPT